MIRRDEAPVRFLVSSTRFASPLCARAKKSPDESGLK
jgi:hypothetical protein